ncbi:MAG TPA: queuosine precursor transporter [Dehalococcoidia bacterium]|nr:queuosine precursor transporter [Dehalococcoidia bacterium]
MVSGLRAPAAGYTSPFLIVATIFIATLLTSNIISVKLIDVGGLVLPAAVIVFPLSYIVGDVLTEVYGFRRARAVIWLGFLANLLLVIGVGIAQALPAPGFWDGQAAYERILGYAPRLLIASFAAYLVGELTNSLILSRLKAATRGRWLWSRTIGSTLVGQGLDSLIFITIAFFPMDDLFGLIVRQWIVKCLYEVVATPLTYLAVTYLKEREGLDALDSPTELNPLPWR